TWRCLAFSPDGRTLAAGDGQDVRLWDLASGMEVRTLRGHTGPVFSVAFGDDKRLASGSRDGTVRLWDAVAGSGQERAAGVRAAWVGFGPDGKTLTATGEGRLKQWDPATGRELAARTLEEAGPGSLAVLGPDGTTVAGGFGDERVRLWDLPGGQER